MHPTRVSDREKAGLRGPVKTCVDFNGDEGEPMFGAEYALDGRLLLEHTRSSPGSRTETVYSYDDAARLASVTYQWLNSGKAQDVKLEPMTSCSFPTARAKMRCPKSPLMFC